MPMPTSEWQVILNTWDYIVEHLIITNKFLDDLISKGTLTTEDQQRICLEPVQIDRNEKLLNVLKHKPSECRAYAKFKEVLVTHESTFIVDEIDQAAQRLQSCKDDSENQILPGANVDSSAQSVKKRVRSLLVKSFRNKPGLSCTLSEILEVVSQVHEEGLTYSWNIDQLRSFVIDDVFVGVVFEKRKNKKPPTFRNIGLIKGEESPECQNDLELHSDSTLAQDEGGRVKKAIVVDQAQKNWAVDQHISSMSASTLAEYLLPRLSDIGLGEETTNKMKAEEIDGKAFLALEEHHLKEYFSEMTLGKRIHFMTLKKEILEEKTSFIPVTEAQMCKAETTRITPKEAHQKEYSYPETFRRFDTEVGAIDSYVKGRIMETEGHLRGNLIIPRRHFICPDEEGTELCRKVARETVIFASACMNERTNGTLHAGVSPIMSEDKKTGEIVGLVIDKGQCVKLVRDFIKESFYEEQLDIAERAIRDVRFIQVTEVSGTSKSNHFVVEVDIVPNATLVGNDAFFVKTQLLGKRRKKRKQDLYRIVGGELKPLSEDDTLTFMEKKRKLTEVRAEQETRKPQSKPNIDLRKKILNLFTGGSDTIEDDIYPVLFTSPLDILMDQEFMKENLVFIQHFDARVIFDFDPKSSDNGLYKYFDEEEHQCYTVLTTDNFQNRGNISKKEANTSHKAWIFSNGYNTLQKCGLQPFEWKQDRSEGFKEALRFYHQNIPSNRAIAVIFLFSKNYDVLLEAAEEILLKFKDHWMVIAENEEIAHLWKNEMSRRNVVKKLSLEERCVIGMPWRDVNRTFVDILQPLKVPLCQLPVSTGAFREMSEKDKNSMCDLEILSSYECDDWNEVHDKDKLELIRRKAEEKFFRGGCAEWWNFWFEEDHVKKRQLHNSLMKEIECALATQKADETVLVTLLHQPGAGGTTTSRQVLWDLRRQYKCCIIKRISDDTAEQIATLRSYGETTNPKPPLILIDNDDEEHVDRILAELEDMARKSARKHEESTNVFCVLLHCVRRASLPRSHEGKQIHLRHDLSPQELTWFRKKHDELQRKYDEHEGVNPQLLISFNLLKNNFNEEYVKRTVKVLMNDITDPNEQRLLRYLSFLNTYDIDFHAIPVACFDPIMEPRTKKTVLMQTGIYRMGTVRQKKWETNIGSSARVLLNESSSRKVYGAKISSIGIISSFLSSAILATFLKLHKLSDILLDMLSSEIFEFENDSTEYLLGILSTIVKKRAATKDDRVEKFAPLILKIMEKEGEDKAADVFIEVFKLTNVAMVAQQLARLYIHYRNWPEAEKYASKATSLVQTNSFLWDTQGQVYEQQLRLKVENSVLTQNVILETLGLVRKAVDIYQREQRVSETEQNKPYNYNGYLGEVRVIIKMFEALWKYQDIVGENDKHAFLVDPDFVPQTLIFLGEEDIEFIKASGKTASSVIQKLEDELLQLKADTKHETVHTNYFISMNDLLVIKDELFRYYGENSDEVPGNMSLEDQCEFRRRRVRQIGGTSLQGILMLRFKDSDQSNLVKIYNLMIQNVQTCACNSFDLSTVLNTLVAMSRYEDQFVKSVAFEEIIELSQKFLELKQQDRPLLEMFLYILLFNVPTPSRLENGYVLCESVIIRDTIKLWKEAFYSKYPRQREEQKRFRKKDTTLFFLGHGDGMEEILHHRQLAVREEDLRVNDDFWHTPIARKRFLRYDGILLMDGLEIQTVFQTTRGNKYEICIPTSMPVKKSMWQKKVYFVLGFSWSGPKAYDVTLDDPSKMDIQKDVSNENTVHQATLSPRHSGVSSSKSYRDPPESRQYNLPQNPRNRNQLVDNGEKNQKSYRDPPESRQYYQSQNPRYRDQMVDNGERSQRYERGNLHGRTRYYPTRGYSRQRSSDFRRGKNGSTTSRKNCTKVEDHQSESDTAY